MGNLES